MRKIFIPYHWYTKNLTSLELCPKGKSGIVNIPKGVIEIEGCSFEHCCNITEVMIPEGVVSIGIYAFSGCNSLTNMILPDSVIEIEFSAFSGCSNLVNITLLKNITSLSKELFDGCSSLESIVIPESVTKIDNLAFYHCESLKEISISESVTTIGIDVFEYCDNLENIIVDENNKRYCSVDGILYDKSYGALMCCPGGKSGEVYIPNGVKTINARAFFECNSLTKVVVSDDVMEIDAQAFLGCRNLTEIVIPENVTSIGNWALGYWIDEKDFRYYKISGLMIYGCIGSEAENYAQVNDIPFLDISLMPDYGKEIEIPINPEEPILPVDPTNPEEPTIPTEPNIPSDSSATQNPSSTTTTATNQEKALAQKITLSGISKQVASGKKIQLAAAITPATAGSKLTWMSGNIKVATVSQTGVVTMKKNSGGKSVTITAAATDGSGLKAVFKIRSMKGVVKKVAVSGAKIVKAGKSVKLKAKVTATSGANKKIKWSSSNTKYATVSASGKVKALKAGKGKKVKITAMATDGSNKKKTVTIKIK